MVKEWFICKSDGTCRHITYHVDDPSDPPEVKEFHGRLPPMQALALHVDLDEIMFDHMPSDIELNNAFATAMLANPLVFRD